MAAAFTGYLSKFNGERRRFSEKPTVRALPKYLPHGTKGEGARPKAFKLLVNQLFQITPVNKDDVILL